MENRTTQQIVLNLLKTKDSMQKMRDYPAKTLKTAGSLDSVAKSKIVELKNKATAYNQLEKVRGLKSGNPQAAGELLSSLLKPRKAPVDSSRKSSAKGKPAAAFCGNCGTKLNPGAAFCPSCGNKIR